MTTTLLPVPKARFFDASGAPLAGGKVYTYVAGTTTPKTTYTDAGGGTPNANPVILDAAGEANIWIQGNYKIVLKNSADVTQWTVDNVSGASEVSVQWLTVTGTDTLIATPQSAVTSYQAQQIFLFYAENTNTTAVTINISGLGAKSITKNGSVALVAGDIVSGAIVQINYDGTRFQMQTVPAGTYLNKATGGSVTGQTSFTNITNTGLNVLDTDASHTLGIIPGSNLTANRTLTLTTGDTNRAVTLLGDTTLTGNNFGALYSYVNGFNPTSISGNATTAAISIAAGQATDSTNSKCLTGSTFSWAVSNGNAANGYQGGTTLPNSTWIHFYVMATATDTTWSASFASTSYTPTLPASYTLYKLVFSVLTSGAGAPLNASYTQVSGGSLRVSYASIITDYNSTVGTSASLITLSTPLGRKTRPLFSSRNASTNTHILLSSPEDQDAAPSSTLATTVNNGGVPLGYYSPLEILTNTSSQIRARADSAGTSLLINTIGYVDFRQ